MKWNVFYNNDDNGLRGNDRIITDEWWEVRDSETQDPMARCFKSEMYNDAVWLAKRLNETEGDA